MKLWIGKEEEGEFCGVKTLFVGSPTITYEEIKDTIEKDNIVEFNKSNKYRTSFRGQIYFGAGICTKLNEKVIKKCLRTYIGKSYIITAEVDINHLHKYDIKLLKRLNLIITINHKNAKIVKQFSQIFSGHQIKLQHLDGENSVVGLTDFEFDYVNTRKLKGKCYKGDIVIK